MDYEAGDHDDDEQRRHDDRDLPPEGNDGALRLLGRRRPRRLRRLGRFRRLRCDLFVHAYVHASSPRVARRLTTEEFRGVRGSKEVAIAQQGAMPATACRPRRQYMLSPRPARRPVRTLAKISVLVAVSAMAAAGVAAGAGLTFVVLVGSIGGH